MKTLSLSEVKMKLSQFVEEVLETDNPISITRNGEAVATLLSQEVYDGYIETLNIMRDIEFYSDILENLHLLSRGEGISLTIDELLPERMKNSVQNATGRIRVLPEARRQFSDIHPEIQAKIYTLFQRISEKLEYGILLKDALDGLAVFQAGEYRVIYRWKMRTIEILALDVRKTTYKETVSV